MINNRIEDLIRELCEDNSSLFSRQIGVTPSVISNITGQRKGKPSFDVIEKIISAFADVNARWLITGEGNMLDKVTGSDSMDPFANETTSQLIKTVATQAVTIESQRKEIEMLRDKIQKVEEDAPTYGMAAESAYINQRSTPSSTTDAPYPNARTGTKAGTKPTK